VEARVNGIANRLPSSNTRLKIRSIERHVS
jgi:hypothetical protein